MYVEESVLGHHEELTRAASVLRDSVAREIQAFSRLSLDRLLKPPSSEYVLYSAFFSICMYTYVIILCL